MAPAWKAQRICAVCDEPFVPCKPTSTTCSPKCRNARNSRVSAERRGDMQRDRGDGKTYRKRNGRHEHVVIAERALGRALLPGEIVHHLDDNRRNNDPSNLQVLTSQAEHARLHNLGRQCPTGCTCARHDAYWRTPCPVDCACGRHRKGVMPK